MAIQTSKKNGLPDELKWGIEQENQAIRMTKAGCFLGQMGYLTPQYSPSDASDGLYYPLI
ncbi:MAG: hypothetical protein RIG62_29670 [Cyclobacteriaceae bacterium]